jgi:hypothetical protein
MHPLLYLDQRYAHQRSSHARRTGVDWRSLSAQRRTGHDWYERVQAMATYHRLLREAGLTSPALGARARRAIGMALIWIGERLQTTPRPDVVTEGAGAAAAD